MEHGHLTRVHITLYCTPIATPPLLPARPPTPVATYTARVQEGLGMNEG